MDKKMIQKILPTLCALLLSNNIFAETNMIFINTAEGATEGLGILSCRGLSRSLNLPDVLYSKYGRADAIYVPDPSKQVNERNGLFFNYRPIMTISPTSIKQGINISSNFGFDDTDKIVNNLLGQTNKTIFIAWNNKQIESMLKTIGTKQNNNELRSVSITESEHDLFYHIRIKDDKKLEFHIENQNLNNLNTFCNG